MSNVHAYRAPFVCHAFDLAESISLKRLTTGKLSAPFDGGFQESAPPLRLAGERIDVRQTAGFLNVMAIFI